MQSTGRSQQNIDVDEVCTMKRFAFVFSIFVLFLPAGCSDDSAGPRCGDGVIDTGEDCDGHALGGRVCTDVNPVFYGGMLSWLGDLC